jgi:hypothetical protein
MALIAPALTNVLGGQVDMMFISLLTGTRHFVCISNAAGNDE